jgi:hypothetical protein
MGNLERLQQADSEAIVPVSSIEASAEKSEAFESRLRDVRKDFQEMDTLLERDGKDESLIAGLDLQGDPKALALQEQHMSRLQALGERVKSKLALLTLAGSLLFGSSTAFAATESTEPLLSGDEKIVAVEESQTEKIQTDQIIPNKAILEKEPIDTGHTWTPVVPGSVTSSTYVGDLPAMSPKETKERNLLDVEDMEEVMQTCLNGEKESCLKELAVVAVKEEIKGLIPFRGGITSINETLKDKSLTDNERVLGVLKGAASVVCDVTMFTSAAGIVKVVEVYRVLGRASDAYDAVSFYAKNKTAVDDLVKNMFKDDEAGRKLVQEKIAQATSGGAATSL